MPGSQLQLVLAERHCLQPREPLAAVGTAEENWPLVAHQFAASVGQDRRQADQARAVLLAATGVESSDETVVWQYAPADSRAAGSDGIAEAVAAEKSIQSHLGGRGV
jgi:hypothetical protein